MNSLGKTVIVDTDGLIALFNKNDRNSNQAIAILEELYKQEARLLHPTTTIVEVVTTLQRKLNQPKLANKIVEMIEASKLLIIEVDEDILKEAVKFFKPAKSKQNTLFDAIVAAVAKKYSADAIFSFDKRYTKLGFKLASSLL